MPNRKPALYFRALCCYPILPALKLSMLATERHAAKTCYLRVLELPTEANL
jgi:hypothetical protein